MPETREQIIERMVQAHFNGLPDDAQRFWDVDDAEGLLAVMGDGLPIAVKAVTDRVREVAQQWAADQKAFRLPRDYSEAISDNTAELLRLLDQIDAELGGLPRAGVPDA